jgi:hypothetical protein
MQSKEGKAKGRIFNINLIRCFQLNYILPLGFLIKRTRRKTGEGSQPKPLSLYIRFPLSKKLTFDERKIDFDKREVAFAFCHPSISSFIFLSPFTSNQRIVFLTNFNLISSLKLNVLSVRALNPKHSI